MNQLSAAPMFQDLEEYQVEKIIDHSVTDFDLFVKLADRFVLYSGPGYLWTRQELSLLLAAGYRQFYLRGVDLKKARMYEAMSQLPQVSQALAPPDRIKAIESLGAKFTQCLYEGELSPAAVSRAKSLAADLTDCVSEDRTCVRYLGDLVGHDYYTYHHSIRVSAYAVAIALSMGLSDVGLLQDLALGGIFHDIGKREVPLQLLNKTGVLTDSEWAVMRSHPSKGHSSLNDTSLAHSTKEIILHHHEKRNGSGYPHGLDRNQLMPEVQIATLADIFDALTSARAYQRRRSRYEALDFIKQKLLDDEVCPEAFRALVSCLAE